MEELLEPPVRQRLGPPVHERLGPPVHERLGPPVHQRLGPPVHQRLGSSVYQRLGPQINQRLGDRKPREKIQKDSSMYTPMSELTEEEKNEFSEEKFTLGKIPVRPPPKEMCA